MDDQEEAKKRPRLKVVKPQGCCAKDINVVIAVVAMITLAVVVCILKIVILDIDAYPGIFGGGEISVNDTAEPPVELHASDTTTTVTPTRP